MSTSETSPALYFQLSLSFISIMLNIIGVYCLHHRKRGNKNQQLLLQNLAVVEILKVPFILFGTFLFLKENLNPLRSKILDPEHKI